MPRSFSQSTRVSCPQCGQPVDLQIWLIVDLAERPDLAARIRDGTLHDAPCPHCGHTGQVDAPLLIHDPERGRVLFSPAQRTTAEQDQQMAQELMSRLAETFLHPRPEYLAQAQSVPRQLLPTLLDGGDLQEAMQTMLARATQEMERLRQEDPETFAQLEQAARQMMEDAAETPTALDAGAGSENAGNLAD